MSPAQFLVCLASEFVLILAGTRYPPFRLLLGRVLIYLCMNYCKRLALISIAPSPRRVLLQTKDVAELALALHQFTLFLVRDSYSHHITHWQRIRELVIAIVMKLFKL